MKDEPCLASVSVHIVTFNSAATISACLDALGRQTFTDYRVVVFDNASSDDTRAIVKRRGAGIELVESGENLGYAAAHNRLIDGSESDYVLTLNPDVSLMPDFIDQMVRVLDADSRIGSAAGCLLRVDQLGDTTSQTIIDSAGVMMTRARRQRLIGETQPLETYQSTSNAIFGPDGAAAFYRRGMLDDIRVMGDVFDEDFFMHKEDIDVCWRAQLRGWSSVYVPDAKAFHVRSFRPGQRERVSAYMQFLGVRNRYLLMVKNEITLHFVRDLPAILLYDIGVLGYVLLKERSSLRAFGSVWQLRKRMLEKRAIIHANRRVTWREMAKWFNA